MGSTIFSQNSNFPQYKISIWIFIKVKELIPHQLVLLDFKSQPRNAQYRNVYRRTIEIPQRNRIFKANCCLKVYNVHLKWASSILGKKQKIKERKMAL